MGPESYMVARVSSHLSSARLGNQGQSLYQTCLQQLLFKIIGSSSGRQVMPLFITVLSPKLRCGNKRETYVLQAGEKQPAKLYDLRAKSEL